MSPFLALLALPFQQTPSTHPAPGTVVASLDGTPITAGEIDPFLWEWKSREIIQEVVNHRIIAAEAARKSVVATDAEIKAKTDELRASVATNLPPGQSIDDLVVSRFGSASHLALIAKTSVLIDKLTAIEFKPADWVKVATIVFRYDGASTDSMSKAIKSADSAYAGLQAGKTWDAVLRQTVTDAETVKAGGLIGWRPVEAFPESVQTQFKAIKPPTFTKPTQTSNGIQIFRLLAKGSTSTAADVADLKALFVKGFRDRVGNRIIAAAKVEMK